MQTVTEDPKSLREKVYELMDIFEWLTVWEINEMLPKNYSDSTITARIRDLRKPQYGGHTVTKRLRNGSSRTREYKLCQ